MGWSTPFADLLPALSPEEFAALKADIDQHGVRQPIEVDEDGNVLDGHNRLCIDPDAPHVVIPNLSTGEKRAHVLRSNSARRNLSREQRDVLRRTQRDVAAELRAEDPKRWTQEAVAAVLGVAQQTVSYWWDQSKSITKSGDTYKSERPDARESLRKEEREQIAARVEAGERQADIAAEFKISQPRVSQLAIQAKKKRENEAKVEAIARKATGGAFDGLYDVIVIDPPWPMLDIEREVRPNQSVFDYPTMNEDELAALKLPTRADCHVWLWSTHRFMPMALRLLDAWKLKYVCTFAWHKPGGFQPVGLPQYNCEFALYARLGAPTFATTKEFPTCFGAPRGKHSEKPERFYDIVRRVTTGRRLDMFNRRRIEGFDGWGKEAAA